jgi:integrase/recombinase XerD
MSDPSRVRVTGPLAPYAAGFAAELLAVGYRPASAALLLGPVAHLSRWLDDEGLDAGSLSAGVVDQFLAARRAAGYKHYLSRKALAPLLEYLRRLGVVSDAACGSAPDEVEALFERYRSYLVEERGLTSDVIRGYVQKVRPFIEARVGADGRLDLEGLAPADVLGFVLADSRRGSRGTAKLVVTGLRSLLRFLLIEGLIDQPLAQVVPGVAGWRLAGLPRGLEREQVQVLLASCDRSTVVGRRDLAILLMLVRLGMRRGEVAALDLDAVDWRAGEVLVRGKGDRVERLPLSVVIRSSLRHVVNVIWVPVLVSEATRILSASSTSSLPLLCVIVPTGLGTPGLTAACRQRPASSGCVAYGCRPVAGCRGAWWARIGASSSRLSGIWRGCRTLSARPTRCVPTRTI